MATPPTAAHLLFFLAHSCGSRNREIATFPNSFRFPQAEWVARSRDRDIPEYFLAFSTPHGSRDREIATFQNTFSHSREHVGREIARSRHSSILCRISRATLSGGDEKYFGMSRSRDLATHAVSGMREVFWNVAISRSRDPRCLGGAESIWECHDLAISRPALCAYRWASFQPVLTAGHPFSPRLPLGVLSTRSYSPLRIIKDFTANSRQRVGRDIARSRHSKILFAFPQVARVARSRDRDIPEYFSLSPR